MNMHWQRRLETRVPCNASQVAQITWLAFVTLAMGLAIPGIQRFYTLLLAPCDSAHCFAMQVTGEVARASVGTGDLRGYATVQTIIALLIAIPLSVAAAFLLWQHANQRLAVLTAFVAVALATGTFVQALAHTDSRFRFPAQCLLFVQLGGLPLLLCLLPDGQLRPRGVRWVALAYLLASTLYLTPFAQDWFTHGTTGHILWLAALALVALLVLTTLAYRIRGTPDPSRRAQLRWILAAIALATPVALTGRTLGLLRSMPLVMELLTASGLWQFANLLFAFASFACLLVAQTSDASVPQPLTHAPARHLPIR